MEYQSCDSTCAPQLTDSDHRITHRNPNLTSPTLLGSLPLRLRLLLLTLSLQHLLASELNLLIPVLLLTGTRGDELPCIETSKRQICAYFDLVDAFVLRLRFFDGSVSVHTTNMTKHVKLHACMIKAHITHDTQAC